MRRFLIAWLLAGSTLVTAGVAGAAQEAAKPPANDDCLACHGDHDAKRADGSSVAVDPAAFAASKHAAMACVGCHADLKSLTEYPHADKLAPVNCASCHQDSGAQYHDSIHGQAREGAGLVVAPNCATCHGTHDIRSPNDPASRVSRANIATTCETCHTGIRPAYDVGIHAAALKKGDSRAPVCTSCHTAHAIQRTNTDAWRLSVTRECATCHTQVVDSFTSTFHGKVTQLGFSQVAACANCHGAHDILPPSNPASRVAPQHLVETCSQCHRGANAQFVKYDPHPNPRDYNRSHVLWYANVFYWGLIPGCFGFFALHSALWFNRSWRDRKAGRRP